MKLHLRQKSLYFLIILAITVTVSFAHGLRLNADIPSISKHLFFGMKDNDVYTLQQILNLDPDTQISVSGAGSPGHETIYFGILTKMAVIRFQTKYRAEILDKNNIKSATGYVGDATLAKLNEFIVHKPISYVQPSSQTQNSTPYYNLSTTISAHDKVLRLYMAVPYQVVPGSTVSLTGTGFDNTDVVHIGDQYQVKTVLTTDIYHLTFTLPLNIQEGKYEIWLTNQTQTSKREGLGIYINITNNPLPVPTINQVSPIILNSINDSVIVQGSGFTKNNSIYTAFGSINGIYSSDGNNLSFQPYQLSNGSKLDDILKSKTAGTSLSVSFYVYNENGMSQSVGTFIIK